jgi:hypothetical protein
LRTSFGGAHGAPFADEIQRPDFCSIMNDM